MRTRSRALLLLAALACGRATPAPSPAPALVAQQSGTTALLQAVSVVSERVVWVSGHRGTWARTSDGGSTWQTGRVPGADTLEFRDVHAVNADAAWLLSAGPGDMSRIYHTRDGGATWTLQFRNDVPQAFYDCFAFWDAERAIAFSDAVDGRFLGRLTSGGGRNWLPIGGLPAAQPQEGGFAASGACVVTGAGGRGWIGTGNAATPRVLRTMDHGRRWQSADVPIVGGAASGITAVAFRDARRGVAVGGALGRADERTDNVAITTDGGETWTRGGRLAMPGAAYGAVYVPGSREPLLVAVGPKGADLSRDGGASWTSLDTLAYWSVGFASPRAGWAVGPGGRITRISLGR